MNQEYIALKGIEFIIDNDPMNSTYKLALCKGATEISYTHAEKAFLSCDSKKLFSLSHISLRTSSDIISPYLTLIHTFLN